MPIYRIGGFEHVLYLSKLEQVDGLWQAFDIPDELAQASVQSKFRYLLDLMEPVLM